MEERSTSNSFLMERTGKVERETLLHHSSTAFALVAVDFGRHSTVFVGTSVMMSTGWRITWWCNDNLKLTILKFLSLLLIMHLYSLSNFLIDIFLSYGSPSFFFTFVDSILVISQTDGRSWYSHIDNKEIVKLEWF